MVNTKEVKAKSIEQLEKELRKAKVLIKMQRKMLNNFMLHDDAGTAYVYLGPSPEDIQSVNEINVDLENVSGMKKYDYILENLYEVELLTEKQELSEEVLSAIELLQEKYLSIYKKLREENEDTKN